MKYKLTITESEKNRIKSLYHEQVLPTEKTGLFKWIDDNNVEFSVKISPNPYNSGNIKIGIVSSVNFPEVKQVGNPNSEPYHYYRDKFKSIIDFIDVIDSNGKSIYNKKLEGDTKFDEVNDNSMSLVFHPEDELNQRLRPGTYFVNFSTVDKWDALSPKVKIKSGILKVQ